MKFFKATVFTACVFVAGLAASASAMAMELDWSGQFRAEYNFIHNYSLDGSETGGNFDATRSAANGYYVPGGGSNDANFQTLFLRLRPKLVVNDNVYIKSEWWLGDPVFGFFGNAVPFTADQRQFYSNQSRGSTVTAQRYWAEILSDIGTFHIGRAPLQWGLGLVWNSGDGLWDRYESTGDVIRLVSKFGAFSFTPAFVAYSAGNNLGGSFNSATGLPSTGTGGVVEYSVMLKYDNPDEDFEGGLNFVKRLGGAAQDNYFGVTGTSGTLSGGAPSGMRYNIWDIYGRKKFGNLTLGAEVPITTGDIGGIEYSTYSIVAEAKIKASDTWDFNILGGHVPGQNNVAPDANPDRIRVFYLNPNYRLGMIMFNYQLANLSGPNTTNTSNANVAQSNLKSPYDNPIVNANYLSLGTALHADKWTFHGSWCFAHALETAQTGFDYYNTWLRRYVGPAVKDQDSSLGWEIDLGTTLQWDETFQFGFDMGLFSPGDFFKFSNTATDNPTDNVFAAALKVGVSF